jgi:hypothetical protein
MDKNGKNGHPYIGQYQSEEIKMDTHLTVTGEWGKVDTHLSNSPGS